MPRALAYALVVTAVTLGATSEARAALPCSRGALARGPVAAPTLPADEPTLRVLRASERAAELVVETSIAERARAYERAFHAALPAWRRLTGVIDTASERRAHEAAAHTINVQYGARIGAAQRALTERRKALADAEHASAARLAEAALAKGAETEWLALPDAERERRLGRFSHAELAALSARLAAMPATDKDRARVAEARERLENACIPPQLWALRKDAFAREMMPALAASDLAMVWEEFERADRERVDQELLGKDWAALRASNAALAKAIDAELAAQRERTLAALGPESRKQFEEDFELVVWLERRAGGLAWSARFSPKPSLRQLQLAQALAEGVEWITRSLEVGHYERVGAPVLARTADEALHRYATLGRRPPPELVKRRAVGGRLLTTGDEALLIPWGWLRHGMTQVAEPRS